MRASIAGLAILLCGAAAAQEAPLSAIPWLSDSMSAPATTPEPGGATAESAGPGIVETSPLALPPPNSAGLLPPSSTGLPRAIWGPATTEDALAALAAAPDMLLPSMRELLTTLLLAEAAPPRGSGARDDLLLARVDRLLALGIIDRAAALLDRAGIETPERFRRYFDIALLSGSETQACARMRRAPEVSPTYSARIFCLARGGDWQAAAVTLETAQALGILSAEEDLLLARFLDPEIPGDVTAMRRDPTPLTFRMLEAIGEPVPTGPLPLAFAWADLRHVNGWKAQIEAAERLARAGALPPGELFGLYLRRRPAASGGVWDRAAAVHRVQAALTGGDTAALAAALPEAWTALAEVDLHHAFARHFGAELDGLALDGDAGRLARRIGLLSPAYGRVARAARPSAAERDFVLALARGTPEAAPATDPRAKAIRQGFLSDARSPAFGRLHEDGRIGEALLRAITLFAEGVQGDPDGLAEATRALRRLGHTETARRAALELLIGKAG